MLSEQRLSEIRARLKAATPGPWRISRYDSDDVESGIDGFQTSLLGIRSGDIPMFNDATDAEFVAHSHTDIADLLAEVERLKAKEGAR